MKKMFFVLLFSGTTAFAQSVSVGSPAVKTNGDGSQDLIYTTTVHVPAGGVPVGTGSSTPIPPITPPIVTPPALPGGPGTGTCNVLSLGKDAALNGFVASTTPELYQDISGLPVDGAKNGAFHAEYSPSPDYVNHAKIDTSVDYSIFDSTQETTPFVNIRTVAAASQSDLVPVPLTPTVPAEGGCIIGTAGCNAAGDHHILRVDRATCKDYELYQPVYNPASGTWPSAYSITVWPLNQVYRRPQGFTSADVAGLSVLIPLLKYDEAASGTIPHVSRVTFNNTNGHFLFPATHAAGNGGDSAYLGMRLRLRADFDISGFSEINQAILRSWKKYGLIVADNGNNMTVTATGDPRWNQDDLNLLGAVSDHDLQVVNTGAALLSVPDDVN